jgi:hypothetical protein
MTLDLVCPDVGIPLKIENSFTLFTKCYEVDEIKKEYLRVTGVVVSTRDIELCIKLQLEELKEIYGLVWIILK